MTFAFGILLVLLGIAVLASLAWAVSSSHRLKMAGAAAGALIGLPLLTMGVFFWTTHGEVLVKTPRSVSPDVEVVELGRRATRDVDQPVAVVATEDRTSSSTEHPEWLRTVETEKDGKRTLVIASGQYAIVDEAERELTAWAGNHILQDFIRHATVPVKYGKLAPPDRKQLAPFVTRTYVEKVDRDFGSFYAPMYRLWWELTFSPETRGHLEPVLLDQVRSQRQSVVSIGLAILAALGGAVWTFTAFLPTTKA